MPAPDGPARSELGDVRYRLGRTEGHPGMGIPPQPDDDKPPGPQPT